MSFLIVTTAAAALVTWARVHRARPALVLALLLGWGAWSISSKKVDTDDPPFWFIAWLNVLAITSVGMTVVTVVWLVRRSGRSRR